MKNIRSQLIPALFAVVAGAAATIPTTDIASAEEVTTETYTDLLLEQAKRVLAAPGTSRSAAKRMLETALFAGDLRALEPFTQLSLEEGDEEAIGLAHDHLTAAVAAGDDNRLTALLGELYAERPRLADPAVVERAMSASVELGSLKATAGLGLLLLEGDVLPQDIDRARGLLGTAATAGDLQSMAALGELLGDSSDRDEASRAIELLRGAAEGGNMDSAVRLAELLVARARGQDDFAEAVAWLERAITDGRVTKVPVMLGDIHAQWLGDLDQAEAAYLIAADSGNTEAMLKLAEIKLSPARSSSNEARQAERLLQEAGRRGRIAAHRALADHYLDDEGPLFDPDRAITSLTAAAEAGDRSSMLDLGQIYRRAKIVPFDFEKARTWYEAAVTAGSARRGYRGLGLLYRTRGPDRNRELAFVMFGHAREAGDSWGAIWQARMLTRGEGVERDLAAARDILEAFLADSPDDGNAGHMAQQLGDLHLNRDADFADRDRALAAYEFAAGKGNAAAKVSLADLLIELGVSGAHQRAIALLEEAVNEGEVKRGAFLLASMLSQSTSAEDSNRARQLYEAAAGAGSGEAHLSLAKLVAAESSEGKGIPELIGHLRAASRGVGSAEVSKTMFGFRTEVFIRSLQGLLSEAGYRVSLDGVHGLNTSRAISRFCRNETISDCDRNFATADVIRALLEK